MKCANRLCDAESLYFRSGSLHAIDDIGTGELMDQEPFLTQKVIWLCENCSSLFTIDTWRPPGEQLHARKPALRIVSRSQTSANIDRQARSEPSCALSGAVIKLFIAWNDRRFHSSIGSYQNAGVYLSSLVEATCFAVGIWVELQPPPSVSIS